MKAILLVGGFSTTLRPITLSLPLPLLEFCNETLLSHQLRALKDAGVNEVMICVHERVVPPSWDAYVRRCEAELGLKIESVKGCDARKHPAPSGEAPWIELVPHPGKLECSIKVTLRP